MVNLVIVSHSAQLGQGVGELARQMLIGNGCKLAIAAGIDDPENPIGTDPVKVMEAILEVADTDHILVLMDIGSALLSAETALDLLDADIARKVRLCPAPLVEGALAATVSAAAGAGIEKVMQDARDALQAKRVQLGFPPEETAPLAAGNPAGREDDTDAQSVTVVVNNPNGLHVRPASRLVGALAGFNARLLLEKDGHCVAPESINQLALLQVRCHDRLRLIASGPEAGPALAAFQALAADNFGEHLAPQQPPASPAADQPPLGGRVLRYTPVDYPLDAAPLGSPDHELRRLKMAVSHTLDDLTGLAVLATDRYGEDIAAIFSGHHTLLDDAALLDEAASLLDRQKCSAEWAWHQVMMGLSQQYRALDDAYLQARYIDVEDLLHRTLGHLADAADGAPALLHPQTIIVTDDIYPSVVLQLETKNLAAICLQGGSPLSHGALIAQAAGIPFICQQGEALSTLRTGDPFSLAHR
ncbi:dihydroxyacetone kinase subunit DhaM [Shimwellia pseudoproteus]|uniref:dihydroxyacetone kinase phosphoryl donor subunit DhaM n=1 Tax=Shimwellia pseudoproteus TaxID=570012 RepID=UPI0018EC5058|nr:dihydroxyacetone kinase phosphoryl donor subunit DhaM [Shimwellia pseudoproteus]MBJ3814978.1 dihydroxyacetone kinase subunit DhaM [Shimwellia pseudoproteus]